MKFRGNVGLLDKMFTFTSFLDISLNDFNVTLIWRLWGKFVEENALHEIVFIIPSFCI